MLAKSSVVVALLLGITPGSARAGADIPPECAAVLEALGRKGDFKDDVCRINIPRTDLLVTIADRPAPTAFGFGGWLALTPGDGGQQVMMGDLVLTEEEVNPVMSALLQNGLEVTALHNHFFLETPRIFYMHVHGTGTPAALAARAKPALSLIGRATAGTAASPGASVPAVTPATGGPALDGALLSKIIGTAGEQNGPVYKVTIGRGDLDVRAHGARIGSRMGLNTWAAFTGSPEDAMVAGDVAMLESEVQSVLKALRSHSIDVVAMHHHMIGTSKFVIFLHYFGRGRADMLAQGVRAAVDQLGHAQDHR